MDRKRNHSICLLVKGVSLLCITVLAAFPLSGCTLKSAHQKEQEKPQGELDAYQKIELTEKEMDQSRFTMELRDDIKIDAKITPYHMYQEGIGTYYNLNGNWWSRRNIISLEKKAKDATVEDLTYFGKSVDQILAVLETAGDRKPQAEKMNWKFNKKYGTHQISVPFTQKKKGKDAFLELRWDCMADKDDIPYLNRKKLCCTSFNIRSDAGWQAKELVESQQYNYIPYDAEKSLSFADTRETAEMLREMLTKLTGKAYSEDYHVIPIDSAYINSVKNVEKSQGNQIESKASNMISPCYYYCFYQELEKLPIRNSSQSIMADREAKFAKNIQKELESRNSSPSSFLTTQIDHHCASYVEIIYDSTGIIYLQVEDESAPAIEPCEGRQPVLNLADLMEPLYEYLDSIVSIETTVYEIRLGYIASFTDTDSGDEPIQRLLAPVWIVKYDTQITGKHSETVFFDGYTGIPLTAGYINIWR